ncbi:1-acyl-sn-glycerol-3-phosphate acyltransferase epsilon [Ixodes scapularis]
MTADSSPVAMAKEGNQDGGGARRTKSDQAASCISVALFQDPVSVARLVAKLCTCDNCGGRGGVAVHCFSTLRDSKFLELRESRGKRLGFCETELGECYRSLTRSNSSYGTESVFSSWFVTRELI